MRKKGLFGALTVAALSILFGVQAFANPVDDAVAARLALEGTVNSGIASVYNTKFTTSLAVEGAALNCVDKEAKAAQAIIDAKNAADILGCKQGAADAAAGRAAAQQAILAKKINDCAAAQAAVDAAGAAAVAQKEALHQAANAKAAEAAAFKASADAELAALAANYQAAKTAREAEYAGTVAAINSACGAKIAASDAACAAITKQINDTTKVVQASYYAKATADTVAAYKPVGATDEEIAAAAAGEGQFRKNENCYTFVCCVPNAVDDTRSIIVGISDLDDRGSSRNFDKSVLHHTPPNQSRMRLAI